MLKRHGFVALALVGLGLSAIVGCDGEADAPASDSADAPLALGSTGARVAKVNQFLTRYGYFENARLRRFYPGWQPMIGRSPAQPDVYDEATKEGVLGYQKMMGIPQTGIVDPATAKLMAEPRCSHPDIDVDRLDPTQKFSVSSAKWSKKTLTFRFEDYPAVGATFTQARVKEAFAQWASASYLNFNILPTDEDADIVFEWILNIPDLPLFDDVLQDGDLARAYLPPDGHIYFDAARDWSQSGLLYRVAMHEIGHALGLLHSSVVNQGGSTAVMYPNIGGVPNALTRDDQQAIGAKYSDWEQMPGKARDISAAVNGYVWAISDVPAGSNGFKVMLWEPGDEAGWYWDQYGGVGVKIASAAPGPATNAFVVNASGQLWERNPTKCGSRGWCQWATPVPAIDVAYLGSSGVPMIIGNDNVVYVHQNGVFQPIIGAPLATKIAAGPILSLPGLADGVWVLRSADNKVRRRIPTGNPGTPFEWQDLPGTLIDVAAGRDGSVFGISTTANGSGGNSIHVWNYQPGDGVPAEKRWLKLNNGAATDITVDTNGIPWVINSARDIFKRRRD